MTGWCLFSTVICAPAMMAQPSASGLVPGGMRHTRLYGMASGKSLNHVNRIDVLLGKEKLGRAAREPWRDYYRLSGQGPNRASAMKPDKEWD